MNWGCWLACIKKYPVPDTFFHCQNLFILPKKYRWRLLLVCGFIAHRSTFSRIPEGRIDIYSSCSCWVWPAHAVLCWLLRALMCAPWSAAQRNKEKTQCMHPFPRSVPIDFCWSLRILDLLPLTNLLANYMVMIFMQRLNFIWMFYHWKHMWSKPACISKIPMLLQYASISMTIMPSFL